MRIKSLSLILLLALLAFASSCRKSEGSSDSGSIDILNLSDQTQEATDLINDANAELKKIKNLYRENNDQVDELKDAMKANDIEKVKKIADNLVVQINEGMNLGEDAISKVEKAQELNINEKFKEYLRLKEQALRKQHDGFRFRFEAAKFLRDTFGGKDKAEIEAAKAQLKEQDDNYQKYMLASRDLSQEANKLYKESLQQTN